MMEREREKEQKGEAVRAWQVQVHHHQHHGIRATTCSIWVKGISFFLAEESEDEAIKAETKNDVTREAKLVTPCAGVNTIRLINK